MDTETWKTGDQLGPDGCEMWADGHRMDSGLRRMDKDGQAKVKEITSKTATELRKK